MSQNELGSNSLTELLEVCYKKARAYDEITKLITDNGLCIGSEYAGDLPAMVNYLIQEAKKPTPTRILVAEAKFGALKVLCEDLLGYRLQNTLNFQLEKADDHFRSIAAFLGIKFIPNSEKGWGD